MTKLDDYEHKPKTVKHASKTRRDNLNEPKSELRGRGLVYIDTDDDVTSIVSKIKATKESVIALVPPKRIGVLQSVVNLKLLQRAAKSEHKRLAIVTVDSALTNLASGLAIPVAKSINAQAKVPDMVDDEEVSDIIDGNDLDLANNAARRGGDVATDREISAAVAAIETDDKIKNDLDADGVPDDEQPDAPKKRPGKKVKIPSVNDLRKKIMVGGGLAIVVIAFLVWAIIIAPQAVITIKAKTSPVDIDKTLSLIPSTDKDVDKGVISPVVKQKKSNESVQFEATGSKEIGEKAQGSVLMCNHKQPTVTIVDGEDTATVNWNAANVTLPAGTLLYAGGSQYVTNADATVPASKSNANGKCGKSLTVKATAVNIGPDANVASGTSVEVAGYTDGVLSAEVKDAFAGGSKKTVKVVQQSDVDAAVAKLNEKGDGDAVKDELKGQMSQTTTIIESSFSAVSGEAKSSPAVGAQSDGSATLSREVTYTLVGVNNDDLAEVFKSELKTNNDSKNQKIYDDGSKNTTFSSFAATNNGYTVVAKTKAHVGPVINEDDVRKQVTGKKSEEIKALLKQTNGVSDVEVSMSPFWVHSAPGTNKIKINFTIDE